MIDYKIIGLAALAAAMKYRQKKLSKMKSANAKAVVIVERWIQVNFQQEGKMAEGGGGWTSLKQATLDARRKGKAKHGDKILQNIGNLKKDWGKAWSPRGGHVWSKQPDYAPTHQFGDKSRNIPARPIIPTEKQIMPELLKIYGKHVKTSLAK